MVRLFVFILAFVASVSEAATPSTWWSANGQPAGQYFSTRQAACNAFEASREAQIGKDSRPTCPATGGVFSEYVYEWSGVFYTSTHNLPFFSASRCDDGTTPVNNVCPDPPPPDPCAGLTGTPLSASDISVPVTGPHVTPQTICETVSNTGGPNGGPLLCTMSYTTKPDGMWAQSPTGQWHFFVYSATQAANYKHTGASCVGSNTGGSGSGTAPAPNETTCPTGKCPGVVNGTNVCVPCSGTATNDSKETTVEKDSTGATTDTTSKDTSVTCQGNYCTINTQTTNASGGTTSSSKTVDKGTFCEENPTHPACTSRWQDEACDKEQTCEGDPIACAQAKLAKKTYCENFVNKTPLSELGEEAANGEATPDGHPRNDAQVSAFNFGAAFSTGGGGGCPSDVSVRGVMVPLSSLCDGLNALGIAALGIALIWAARVVFGE